MECRLRNLPSPWQCQVLLRFETDVTGQRLNDIRETRFGPVVRDPFALETMVRRAQLAILNPGLVPDTLLELSDAEMAAFGERPPSGSKAQLKFSSNVVCLDVSGPALADLSFVDLPGV